MTKKYDIISLNNHLYMVDKEAIIKEGDRVYCRYGNSGNKFWHKLLDTFPKVQGVVLHTNTPNELILDDKGNDFYANDFYPILASTDTTLGLPLLPKVEEDGEEISRKLFPEPTPEYQRKLWLDGYKAASVKKYDEVDMRKAFMAGGDNEIRGSDGWNKYKDSADYLQSLTPKPIAVEVAMEDCVYDKDNIPYYWNYYQKTNSYQNQDEHGFYAYKKKEVKGWKRLPKTKDNIVVVKRWIL